MNLLPRQIKTSSVAVRVLPFVLFLVLTALQPALGVSGKFWIYLLKTVVGAWLLYEVWPFIPEMRWRSSLAAVGAGILVFLLWVGLAWILSKVGLNPRFAFLSVSGPAWNPKETFGASSFLAWFFVVVRIAGSTLVVPPLEEVFFRSFVYRYIKSPDFEKVPLGAFFPVPFVVTSVLFGFEHQEWLAGILCGFVYQGLVCWKKRLGDAMTAHAITNFLLGTYVVTQDAWKFW
ncbi:MAG TPA: CAAX prenyl protease-related protein [Candidatus Saccharimonadales bacterium]|nr:CAAX prenyl protease-related protein [Candidatus Saccharimonadales bacterium]